MKERLLETNMKSYKKLRARTNRPTKETRKVTDRQTIKLMKTNKRK